MRRCVPFVATMLLLLPANASADPPNFIFMMFDDLGYGSLSHYWDFVDLGTGEPGRRIDTPNLDGLAENGLVFTQYYANAPVCSPTRSSVMSGRFPAAFGIRTITNRTSPTKGLPATAATLSQLFDRAGYRTAHIGKWHLGTSYPEFRPTAKGYDRTAILDPGSYFNDLIIDDVQVSAGGVHLTERLIDEAIRFLGEPETQSGNFFINLWFLTPHKNFCEVPIPLPSSPPPSEFDHYKALVENADHQIGRLLNELSRLGRLGETVIVVTSDNGGYRLHPSLPGTCSDPCCADNPPSCADPGIVCDPSGRQHLTNGALVGGKRDIFEGGIRVPFIVHWPDMVTQPAATQLDSPLVSMDLLPTFAYLAGVPVPAGLDGESFADLLLTGGTSSRSTPLVWENKSTLYEDDITYGVRDGDFKLVRHGADGFGVKKRLYNIALDPGEANDLVDPASQPPPTQADLDKRDELDDLYAVWRRDTGLNRIEVFEVQTHGSVTTAQDQEQRWEITATGGWVSLSADPLLDVNVDDFTVSAWIRPAAASIDGGNFNVIAAKDGSWELRVAPDDHLALTVQADACDGVGDPPDCGVTRILKFQDGVPVQGGLPPRLEAGVWYHVAFTLFHNHEVDENAHLSLSLQEFGSSTRFRLEHNALAASVESTPAEVTLGNTAAGDRAFRGKIFDPRLHHARLTQADLGLVADQDSELGPCPRFQNHQKRMGPPGANGWGEVWTAEVLQTQVLTCCNPSQRCNNAGACRLPGTVGPDNANGFGTACVRSSDDAVPPNLLPIPATYTCTPSRVGQILTHEGEPAFCCTADLDFVAVDPITQGCP